MKKFRTLVFKMAHKMNKGNFSEALKKAWKVYRIIMNMSKGFFKFWINKDGVDTIVTGTLKKMKISFDGINLPYKDIYGRIYDININNIL